jgi:hypothetical protein
MRVSVFAGAGTLLAGMAGGSAQLSPPTGTAAFDVERFAWTSPDRLEVCGRWYGVRGLRFVRPTLEVAGPEGTRRRMLAVLEHKPWAALDGEEWVAAFPWEGDPCALDETHLAVAPSVVVALDPPAAPGVRRRPAPKGAQRAQLQRERDAALEARDDALRRVERVRRTAEAAVEDRVAPVREHFEREREELEAERDAAREAVTGVEAAREAALARAAKADEALAAALRDRDAALARAEAARGDDPVAIESLRRERDDAAGAAETLRAERDEARRVARALHARAKEAVRLAGERDEARAALAQVEAERDAAQRARDAARDAAEAARRDATVTRRDEAIIADLADAVRERDAAVAQVQDLLARLQAAEAGAPVTAPAPRHASWGPRLLALGALAALIVVLAVLLDGVV